MRIKQTDPMIAFFTVIFISAIWAIGLIAHADPAPPLEYKIQTGDSLSIIADDHGIKLDELMQANEIDNPNRIKAGQKLIIPINSQWGVVSKRGVTIVVPKGFSLSRIAAAYKVSVKQIIRANNLKNPDHVRFGQKLLIPGAKTAIELVPPPPCFKPATEVYRIHNQETHKIPLTYCDGTPNPKALEVLSQMSGPLRKEMPFPLHSRLMQLLQKIADRFPGRRIEIVSGQRVRKNPGHESYHNKGQAMDFRVQGVSNKELSSFVRTLKDVGVGYYPNSVFIHMDTREKSAYWIDYSRPGEKAIYGRAGMTKEALKKIRVSRRKPAKAKAKAKAQTKDDQPAEITAKPAPVQAHPKEMAVAATVPGSQG